MKKLYLIGSIFCLLTACKPNLELSTPNKGAADFSRYLAVGNSLTAGYADGSLYRSGQLNSYPERLAEQFKLAGGGPFKQPLMPGNDGYPNTKFVLKVMTNCAGTTALTPVPVTGAYIDSAGSLNNISIQGPFNNVGVPGIRCADYLTPGYATLAYALAKAPYAYRFYSSPATETPLDEALKLNATFFTCWLGSNDVLGYALNGGTGKVAPAFPFPGDITSITTFTTIYDSVVNALTKKGATGVLINIPDITAIPFFTTIPPNGLTLRQSQADSLNAAYKAAGIPSFNFKAGANHFVIADPAYPIGFRQIKDDELLLLSVPADSITCAGWGSAKPIPVGYTLNETQISNIKSYTTQYNQVIAQAAATHNLVLVDMFAFLKTVQKGIGFDGIRYNATFVSGGTFSLDGVHLTPRGYAIVANQILTAINNRYGSTLPMINTSLYNGLLFP